MKTMRFVREFLYASGNAPGNKMTLMDSNRLDALRAGFGDQVKTPHRLPQFSDDTGVYPTWDYAGIWFRCLPTKSGGPGSGYRGRVVKHRFQFRCPECERWISVGRVHQHIHDRAARKMDRLHAEALREDRRWTLMQITHGIALKENEWRKTAVRCDECGALAQPKALHFPGQQGAEPAMEDHENGPAHRQVDVRSCIHCEKPARKDAEECQTHYEIEITRCRARELCGACSSVNGPAMHELCEGCQCQEGDCNPWTTNAQMDHDAEMEKEYRRQERLAMMPPRS